MGKKKKQFEERKAVMIFSGIFTNCTIPIGFVFVDKTIPAKRFEIAACYIFFRTFR